MATKYKKCRNCGYMNLQESKRCFSCDKPFVPANCSVERTNRQVIERKLLDALGDENTVACLFSKQDLEDLIQACEHNQFRGELWDRCSNLAGGMKQLLREAFPPNAEVTGQSPVQ